MNVYVTAEQIAEKMQVSLRTAYAWMKRMKHFQEGRIIRVTWAAFEAWKRERENEGCAVDEQSSGSANEPTDGSVMSGGRISTVDASPRTKRPSRTRRRGSAASSAMEPIHVAQPRRRPPSPRTSKKPRKES